MSGPSASWQRAPGPSSRDLQVASLQEELAKETLARKLEEEKNAALTAELETLKKALKRRGSVAPEDDSADEEIRGEDAPSETETEDDHEEEEEEGEEEGEGEEEDEESDVVPLFHANEWNKDLVVSIPVGADGSQGTDTNIGPENSTWHALFVGNGKEGGTLSPSKVIQCLCSPLPPATFFQSIWGSNEPQLLDRAHLPTEDWEGTLFGNEAWRMFEADRTKRHGIDFEYFRVSAGGKRKDWERGSEAAELGGTALLEKGGYCCRIREPHLYARSLWQLAHALEKYFQSAVSMNILRAGDKCSWAALPHYTQVETFFWVLQGSVVITTYEDQHFDQDKESVGEGEEVPYPPRHIRSIHASVDILPDIVTVAEKYEVSCGNILYMPRGKLHSIAAVHKKQVSQPFVLLSISTYAEQSWWHLLEAGMPRCLQMVAEESPSLRENLPLQLSNNFGIVHSEDTGESKQQHRQQVLALLQQKFVELGSLFPLDALIDHTFTEFLQAALPPPLSRPVASHSARRNHKGRQLLTLESKLRLTEPNIARFVIEDDNAVVYSSIRNPISRLRCGEDFKPLHLVYPLHYGPAMEFLLNSYPQFVDLKDITTMENEEKRELIAEWYDRGMLVTKKVLGS
jgi:hypothetical protein